MKQKKAFTLIELMVVVSIISILAVIGMSSYTSAIKKARDSKKKADIQNIVTALTLYRSESNHPFYPAAGELKAQLVDAEVNYLNNDTVLSDNTKTAYPYTPRTAAGSTACVGSNTQDGTACKKFTICTTALEYPKGNANSASTTELTDCENTDNKVEGTSACKYYCMTNQ